jgi:hypothetical protein
MSANNPLFNNAERAAYELPNLLTKLGVTSLSRPLVGEQRQLAEAAIQHASNASVVILDGIESIGHLLSYAALNESMQLSSSHINNIGVLIAHLAVEAQAMRETESDLRVTLEYQNNSGAKQTQGVHA